MVHVGEIRTLNFYALRYQRFNYTRVIRNFITLKIFAYQCSIMAGSFSITCVADIKLKLPELNITAHISALFHVTIKNAITP